MRHNDEVPKKSQRDHRLTSFDSLHRPLSPQFLSVKMGSARRLVAIAGFMLAFAVLYMFAMIGSLHSQIPEAPFQGGIRGPSMGASNAELETQITVLEKQVADQQARLQRLESEMVEVLEEEPRKQAADQQARLQKLEDEMMELRNMKTDVASPFPF